MEPPVISFGWDRLDPIYASLMQLSVSILVVSVLDLFLSCFFPSADRGVPLDTRWPPNRESENKSNSDAAIYT